MYIYIFFLAVFHGAIEKVSVCIRVWYGFHQHSCKYNCIFNEQVQGS